MTLKAFTYTLLFSLFFAFGNHSLLAQKRYGPIWSKEKNEALSQALVMVYHFQDSTILYQTRTNKEGFFTLPSFQSSQWIWIFYPGYAAFQDTLKNLSNDTVYLTSKIKMMEAIVINKYDNGIRISGDTTEYLADYFKTRDGASIEELIKKLPGLKIDKNGTITAQGVPVTKMTIDGEEFFTEDPNVTTQYLKADMVDKIQVIHQQSSDGNPENATKTMNIELKDEAKKGKLANISGNTNGKQFHQANLFALTFSPHLNLSAFAKGSTFSNSQLNYHERNLTNENQGIYRSNSGDFASGVGIPRSLSTGINYRQQWNQKKQKLYVNLSGTLSDINGVSDFYGIYYLPDTSYSIKQIDTSKAWKQSYIGNASFTLQLDSQQSLTIGINGNQYEQFQSKNGVTYTLGSQNDTVNRNRVFSESTENNENGVIKLDYFLKSKKSKRAFESNFSAGSNKKHSEQTLQSGIKYYKKSIPAIISDINQEAQNQFQKDEWNWTNKMHQQWKKHQWFIETRWNYSKEFNKTETRNKILLNELVDNLSNEFTFTQNSSFASIKEVYSINKSWIISGELGYQFVQLGLNNIESNQKSNFPYHNFLPKLEIMKKFKKMGTLNFSYSQNANNPSIQALQPIVRNNDPLNIQIGNPNLKQSVLQNLSLRYYLNQTMKDRYISGRFYYSQTQNDFSSFQNFDTNGVRSMQTVNIQGNNRYGVDVYTYTGTPIDWIYLDLNTRLESSTRGNFTNGFFNATQTKSYTQDVGIDLEGETINLYMGTTFQYQTSTSSLNPNSTASFVIWNPNFELNLYLKGNWAIEISGDYNIRPATAQFNQPLNVFYLNGKIEKAWGKSQIVKLRLSVNDLLNQNIGFQRDITGNFITENRYTQLARYWLFGVVVELRSKPKSE